jgi:hypothetical protein
VQFEIKVDWHSLAKLLIAVQQSCLVAAHCRVIKVPYIGDLDVPGFKQVTGRALLVPQ